MQRVVGRGSVDILVYFLIDHEIVLYMSYCILYSLSFSHHSLVFIYCVSVKIGMEILHPSSPRISRCSVCLVRPGADASLLARQPNSPAPVNRVRAVRHVLMTHVGQGFPPGAWVGSVSVHATASVCPRCHASPAASKHTAQSKHQGSFFMLTT